MPRLDEGQQETSLSRFTGRSNIKDSDSHMHTARYKFIDAGRIAETWGSMKDGNDAGQATFELARQK
jgi:hypothetical protein